MASTVQLKRSALSGKVPDTGSLALGEIAINTYDGKIFFKKSGSIESIEGVVTTNAVTTGSITLSGTGSFGKIIGTLEASNGIISGSSQITLSDTTGFSSFSSSLDARIIAATNEGQFATTGSNEFTGSQNITGSIRVTETGSFGSLQVNDTLTVNHGISIISGSLGITSDLTVLGAINARQFNINVISSSTIFESGSSNFGNSEDDTHTFTGSVSVTGSLLLNGINVGPLPGPNTFDFNLDPDAAGTVNFIANDGDQLTKVVAQQNNIQFIVNDIVVANVDANGIDVPLPSGLISSSQQLTEINLFTSSANTRLNNLELTSASLNTSVSNINLFTSSQLTQNSTLATYTGSVETRLTEIAVVTSSLISSASTSEIANANQNLFTGSVNTRLTEIGVVTGSLITSASEAKTKNDTQDTSISNLNTFSSSVNTRLTQVGVVTGSLISSASADRISITNLNLLSASQQVSIDNLNLFSSSANTRFTEIGVVSGSLISSASSFESRFGTLSSYTGSVDTRLTDIGVVTGSLISSASAAVISNSNLNSFTASANTRFTEIGVVSGSLILSASAAAIADTNQNLFTASADTRLNNLEITSGSVNISVSNLNSFSSSTLGRLSNLESKSASVDISVLNINNTTGSLNTSVSNLNSFTASQLGLNATFATTGSNQFSGSQIITGSLILNSLTYNTASINVVSYNTGSDELEYTTISDLTFTKNIISVALDGSRNAKFTSIKAAVDSITDASETNPYTVRVSPGVYNEDTIIMKSWIAVKGDSSTTTIVSASNANATIFQMADQSMVIDMQIQGSTDPNTAAVVYSSNTTPQRNAIAYVENVRFGTNYTNAKVIGSGSSGNCILQCSNVKYGGYTDTTLAKSFDVGFHVTSGSTGGIGRLQLRNVTSTNGGVAGTDNNQIFALADAPGCTIIVNGCLLTRSTGTARGTGFKVYNGGSLRLTGVNFQRWIKGIWAPQIGSAPSIDAIALNFENCTTDVAIEHTGSIGKVQGTDNFLKTQIAYSSSLYEVGKDARRIHVAKKGGDFTSISASVAYITDSNENNRYVIEVGPGQYTENTIDLTGKPYVSIVGSNIQTTQIFPSSSTQDIIKMGINNEISFLSLTNAGSGYSAILVDDVGDFAQAHKISIYDCDTGIKVLSNTNDTQFYGEYIDINGTFTYGAFVSASGDATTQCNLENYYLFPSGCAVVGNYVIGESSSLALYSSKFQGDNTPNGTAISIDDGAQLEGSSLDIQNWDYGIRIPNNGSGPNFRLVGTMIHNSSTYDIDILNSTTRGRFQGVSDHSKINTTSQDVYWNFLDDNDGELDITRKVSVTFEDGTHTDASTLIFNGSPMGVMEGGVITISSGFTITTSAGYGYCRDSINQTIYKRLDWNNTSISLSANSNNYIYLSSNGVLNAAGSAPSSITNIILGRVVTNDNGVEFIDQAGYDALHTSNKLSKFNRDALGPVYANGSIVTEGTTPFTLDVTAGSYYFSENNFTPAGTSSVQMIQYYPSSSVWDRSISSSIVPSDVFASGSSLVAMSSSYYTKHSLYLIGDGADEKYFLVLNTNQYSSLVAAEDAALPSIPSYFNDGVVALANIYVQSGSAAITEIEDIRPRIGFRAAGVNASSVHGNLLGLSADDHTQYLLVNGGREMSGDLGLGGNNLYNVGYISGSSITASAADIKNISSITITATSFTGSLSGTINNIDLTSFINSTDNRLNAVGTFTSSANVRLNNLETTSASVNVSINNINTFTGSVETIFTTLATTTGSYDTRFGTLSIVTASLNTSVSNINTFTASQLTQNSALATLTGSYDTRHTTIGTYTSSLETRMSAVASATGSLQTQLSDVGTYTASMEIRMGVIATVTGSYDTRFTTLGPVTSSLNLFSSSQLTQNSTLGTYTSSVDTRFTTLGTLTGSYDSRFSTLATYTGSVDSRFTTLATTTGSYDTRWTTLSGVTSSLNSFTSSANVRLNNLETKSASVDTSVSNLNQYTNSFADYTGNPANYVSLWKTKLTQTTSSLYQGAHGGIAIGTTTFDGVYPEYLLVSASGLNAIVAQADQNSYIQLNIQNNNGSSAASSDVVATNDIGTETGNFIDMGINSSTYTGLIGVANEAYLYTTGSNLLIGNTTRGANANIKFFAGNDASVFPLIVTGSNIIASGSFSGSYVGNASTATLYSVVKPTTTYNATATSGQIIVLADTTAGTFNVNLPTAVSNTAIYTIKKIRGTAALVVDANGTETIDGGLTATLNVISASITLISDNANWFII